MFESLISTEQQMGVKRSTSLVIAVAVSMLMAVTLLASKFVQADVRVAHSTLVSENASVLTPGVVDGSVKAIAVDGDTVFVGGTFTQIQNPLNDEILDQAYLFAYSKSTGDILSDFDPILNNAVMALQTTGEGKGIFAGGNFTIVNGEKNRKGLIKLDNFGDRIKGFSARPNKRVYAMDRSGDILYIGGNFDRIGQTPIEYLAAIDTTTGNVLPDINLDFDGIFTNGVTTGFASVDIIEVTSDNELMVVVGNFRRINGLSRPRLALIELGNQAKVSTWNTNIYDTQCPSFRLPQYLLGVDIAPDDSYFIVGTSGYREPSLRACDTINRFDLNDLTDNDVQPTWTTYTGGDTVYEVAASEHAIYVGGHFRTLNNDFRSATGFYVGPGAVERRGLAALDPLNGLPILNWRSDRNPRGVGTFALEIQPEGLYIGDDTDFINGLERPKLKFLPIGSNTISRPGIASLPTTILSTNTLGNTLDAIPFDGTTLGTPAALSDIDWTSFRGAMFLAGQLFHVDDDGAMWTSRLREDNTLEPRTPVDLLGLNDSYWDTSELGYTWQLTQLGGMFFDHQRGRVYYTLESDERLFWRSFTPDGPLFGEKQYITDHQGDILWGDVQSMDVIDDHLYFTRTDDTLYRAEVIDGNEVISGTTQALSGPAIDGRTWNNRLLAFSSGFLEPIVTGEEYQFNSSGSDTDGRWQVFNFDVSEGEQISAEVTWVDPDADVRIFLRDQNKSSIAKDIDGGQPASVSGFAANNGRWSIAVQIRNGATDYEVVVKTTSDFEPGADSMFESSGSATTGRWQVFEFDVAAGEQVDAEVVWDDPTAEVTLYLRDESNKQLDRNTAGLGSGTLSALASTSGSWSVAVRIVSGSVNYSVSINTDAGPDSDGDGVADIFDAFPNDPTETGDTDGDGIGNNADKTPIGDNIAIGKIATQSSTFPGAVASRAIDGITNGDWDIGSVASTRIDEQAWWQLDLENSVNIGLIRIYNRTNCCPDRLSDFYVFVSDKDMSNLGFSELQSDPAVDNVFFSGRASDIEDFSSIGNGRFVKIQLAGTNYLSLAEVEVYEALLP